MAVFTFHNFGDDGVQVEWLKSLSSLEYGKCDKLIDQYKKSDSKGLPPISGFVQEYWRYETRNKEAFNCNCSKCGGKGFIAYHKKYEHKGKMQSTDHFIAHCDCAAGENFKYDGTKKDDRKSDYYIPSAAELGLVEEKISVSGIDEIKRQTYKFLGIRMGIQPRQPKPPWEN